MKVASEPAFPLNLGAGDHYSGLTKREYFAGLAMQGVLSCMDDQRKGSLVNPKDIAMVSVGYAEALLAELEKVK